MGFPFEDDQMSYVMFFPPPTKVQMISYFIWTTVTQISSTFITFEQAYIIETTNKMKCLNHSILKKRPLFLQPENMYSFRIKRKLMEASMFGKIL